MTKKAQSSYRKITPESGDKETDLSVVVYSPTLFAVKFFWTQLSDLTLWKSRKRISKIGGPGKGGKRLEKLFSSYQRFLRSTLTLILCQRPRTRAKKKGNKSGTRRLNGFLFQLSDARFVLSSSNFESPSPVLRQAQLQDLNQDTEGLAVRDIFRDLLCKTCHDRAQSRLLFFPPRLLLLILLTLFSSQSSTYPLVDIPPHFHRWECRGLKRKPLLLCLQNVHELRYKGVFRPNW